MMLGGVATENKASANRSTSSSSELTRIAANGPTAEELDNAKRYLTGSYALRFSSSAKIADILLWLQIEDLGIDYIDKRNALIEAVTLDDIKRVAKTAQAERAGHHHRRPAGGPDRRPSDRPAAPAARAARLSDRRRA